MRRPCDNTLIKDQDDGDHGVMPVTMEIMTVLWRDQRHKMMMAISCHIFLIACDVYLLCILFLLSTAVAL